MIIEHDTPVVSISKRDFDKKITDAKTEVAEKIFAEIKEFMEVALMNGDVQQPILCIGMGAFEAIKKRYTKE